MLHQFEKDKLRVLVYEGRQALGKAAASMVSEKIREILAKQSLVNIIFAAAPSQNEFLDNIAADRSIHWDKINAFHMDEYLGLDSEAPQRFGYFLKMKLFKDLPFRSVNYIDGCASNIDLECGRHTALLSANPPDIVCMGIGENTHLAFNDPPLASFTDPQIIKTVTLDNACRQQQVNDGCFNSLEEVPRQALTLTIPALMSAKYIYCMVPGKRKAAAITQTLNEPVNEKYPSTILRTHNAAVLFTDADSYAGVINDKL